MRPLPTRALRRLALALALSPAVAVVARAEEPALPTLSLEEQALRAAPAVLPIRGAAAIHVSLMGQAQSLEIDLEGMGVVADPSGLLLVSNTSLGGTSSPLFRQLEEALGGAKISVHVTRLRVQLPEETAERDAIIVLRDAVPDLAWLQVLGLGDRTVPAVDVTRGGELRVGQRIVGVTRRDRRFDHAPSVTRGYVSARITTPRLLWAVAGEFSDVGHMAFDAAGRPLGVLVPQVEAASGSPELGLFLLPLDVVRKSLEAAKAAVPEALAAHEKAEAQATEPPAGAGTGPESPPAASPEAPR